MIRNKRILITGGAGFIGSNLAEKLVTMDNKVTLVDDLSTGLHDNIKNLDADFFEISTTDYDKLEKIYLNVKPEYVFHLAANTNVPKSINEPLYDFKTLSGTLNLLDITRGHAPKLFYYMSSGFIFGNTKNRPIKEDEPFKPISPYAITKRTIENYLEFYHSVYGLNFVGLRPPTVYGPKQTKGAMADYIDKLSHDSQAEIYGDGNKTRDYVYIDDVIEAILLCTTLESPQLNQIYNVGTKIETSLNDLYEKIAIMLKKEPKPIYKEDRPGELINYSLDYDKFHKSTGWKPKVSFDQGIEKLLIYRKLIDG